MKQQQPHNSKPVQISRREALKLFGAGSLGLLLASCASPTTEPGAQTTSLPATSGAAGKTQIRYWTFFGSGEADNPRAQSQGMILDAFRKANPDIEVIEEVIPWNELQTQLIQAATANRAPDVTRQLDQYVSLLAQAGAILPLDEFVSDWGEDKKKDFVYPWDDTVIAGKKYGFRQSVRVANLNFFRPDLFKEAGFESPPLSVEEFTEAVKVITKGPVVGFAMPFSKADNINRFMQTVPSLYWSLGSDLVDANTGKATFHGDEGVQIIQWFQDMVHVHKVIPIGATTMDSEAVNQMFQGGTLASNWHHSSQWSEWISLVRENKLATSTLPNFTGGLTPGSTEGGWTLQMSKGANKDAAWKLIEFFHSKEAELMDAQVAGELPTTQTTLQDPFFQTEDFARPLGWLKYLQENGHPATTIKIEHRQELADLLGDALQKIIAEKADVKSTLSEAASQFDKVVEG
jgi:multiple sugar transport system substrate-binding protein